MVVELNINLIILILAIGLIIAVIVLAALVYNYMLLTNQINKRLLVMTKESQEKERVTMEEYKATLEAFEKSIDQPTLPEDIPGTSQDEEQFDPHTYDINRLEE